MKSRIVRRGVCSGSSTTVGLTAANATEDSPLVQNQQVWLIQLSLSNSTAERDVRWRSPTPTTHTVAYPMSRSGPAWPACWRYGRPRPVIGPIGCRYLLAEWLPRDIPFDQVEDSWGRCGRQDVPVLDDLAIRHAEDVGLDEAPGSVLDCPHKILI